MTPIKLVCLYSAEYIGEKWQVGRSNNGKKNAMPIPLKLTFDVNVRNYTSISVKRYGINKFIRYTRGAGLAQAV